MVHKVLQGQGQNELSSEIEESGHVSCVQRYQRTIRKPNQMSLDVVLRIRTKERNIFFLFFLHELIILPKHVRISSLPHTCTVDKLNYELYKYIRVHEGRIHLDSVFLPCCMCTICNCFLLPVCRTDGKLECQRDFIFLFILYFYPPLRVVKT
jgi:hypothetical protein